MGGINTTISYKGHSFHIQTQDHGLKTNHIESLIYRSGRVLTSRKIAYNHLLNSPRLKEEIEKLMNDLHQSIVQEITGGKLDHQLGLHDAPFSQSEASLSPEPSSVKTESEAAEKLEVKLINFSFYSPSSPLSLSLEGRVGRPSAAVPFLSITIQVITEFGHEDLLFKGLTDENGKLILGLSLPHFSEKKFYLSVKGEKEGLESDEVKIFLKKD